MIQEFDTFDIKSVSDHPCQFHHVRIKCANAKRRIFCLQLSRLKRKHVNRIRKTKKIFEFFLIIIISAHFYSFFPSLLVMPEILGSHAVLVQGKGLNGVELKVETLVSFSCVSDDEQWQQQRRRDSSSEEEVLIVVFVGQIIHAVLEFADGCLFQGLDAARRRMCCGLLACLLIGDGNAMTSPISLSLSLYFIFSYDPKRGCMQCVPEMFALAFDGSGGISLNQ